MDERWRAGGVVAPAHETGIVRTFAMGAEPVVFAAKVIEYGLGSAVYVAEIPMTTGALGVGGCVFDEPSEASQMLSARSHIR